MKSKAPSFLKSLLFAYIAMGITVLTQGCQSTEVSGIEVPISQVIQSSSSSSFYDEIELGSVNTPARPYWVQGSVVILGYAGTNPQILKLTPNATKEIIFGMTNQSVSNLYISASPNRIAWIPEDPSYSYPVWQLVEDNRTSVTTNRNFKEMVVATDSFVTWVDYRNYSAQSETGVEIYIYNQNREYPLTNTGTYKSRPSASPELIAWIEYPERIGELYAWNKQDSSFFTVPSALGHRDRPWVHKKTIVWEEFTDSESNEGDIYSWTFGDTSPHPICTASGHQGSPWINEDWIIWEDYRHAIPTLFGYDRRSGKEHQLVKNSNYICCGAIEGNRLAYLSLDSSGIFKVMSRELSLDESL